MATNLLLYPLDYESGNSAGKSLTIETAITNIRVQARDTALKEAHTRRFAGQNSIDLQNRSLSAGIGIMPLYQVGAATPVVPFLGTQALLGGGRGYTAGKAWANMSRLTFSGETFLPISLYLSSARLYIGTVSDATSGKFCGGTGGDVPASNVIDRAAYAEASLFRLAATIGNGIWGAAGGLNTKTYGYLLGGSANNVYLRSSYRFSHALNTMTYQGELTTWYRVSPHNGAGNAFNGYIFGGTGFVVGASNPNVFTWGDTAFGFSYAILNAGKLNYATEAHSTVSIAMDIYHVAHATLGSPIKAYIAAGSTGTVGGSFNPYSNSIYGFTYSGETGALLSATLAEAKICTDGANSSVAGYVIGGDTAATWAGTTSIDRLTFGTEANVRIGATLYQPFSDQGSASDYGAGFIS